MGYAWRVWKLYNPQRNITGHGFRIVFERPMNQFFINLYIPTGTMVVISFVSFIIPVETVPGRMTLLVTTFLMLVNIGNSRRQSAPKVQTDFSYLRI